MEAAQLLTQSLKFNFSNFSFSPSYFQAGAIIFLVFLLLLMVAQVRRHLLDWSIKGAVFGLFLGFLLALGFEGFLVIGGKTAVSEILGWKDAPKPLLSFIDMGRERLMNVLGVKDEIPTSIAKENLTVGDVIQSFQNLDPSEVKKAKSIICSP